MTTSRSRKTCHKPPSTPVKKSDQTQFDVGSERIGVFNTVLMRHPKSWLAEHLSLDGTDYRSRCVTQCSSVIFRFVILYMETGNVDLNLTTMERKQLLEAARDFRLPALIYAINSQRIFTADGISIHMSRFKLCTTDFRGVVLRGRFYQYSLKGVDISKCCTRELTLVPGTCLQHSVCKDILWSDIDWDGFNCDHTMFDGSTFPPYSNFANCNFPNTSFVGCQFGSCGFQRCEFRATDFENVCFSEDVRFINCHFIKIVFQRCKFKQGVSFEDCKFDDVSVANSTWHDPTGEISIVAVINSMFTGISGAHLNNSSFGRIDHMDLSHAIADGVHYKQDIVDCDFRFVHGSASIFDGNVHNTDFSSARLRTSIFHGVLENCKFDNADLSDVIFENGVYDLQSEMFRNANLNHTWINGNWETNVLARVYHS